MWRDICNNALGSSGDGDPYTTNLYVGNLTSTADEDVSIRARC